MEPLTVNELIGELQEVAKMGHGSAPVFGLNMHKQDDPAYRVTSIWDYTECRVNLTLEQTDD
jgi:hypothetical protein